MARCCCGSRDCLWWRRGRVPALAAYRPADLIHGTQGAGPKESRALHGASCRIFNTRVEYRKTPGLCLRIQNCCAHAALMVAFLVSPALLSAQTDEIQVYDAAIAEPGVLNLMIHSNYTPIGRKTPDFPGAIAANGSLNGTAEWAYGVTDWFEQGLYLPVYSLHSEQQGLSYNGFKLRELFVRPHAEDHTLFYGVNFEFSVNQLYWESKRITSEVRPIIGLHLKPQHIDLIFNPIVDTNYNGGLGNLEFVPATRIAYNLNDRWSAAVEEYSDFGPLHHFYSPHDQFQEVWAVMDHTSKIVNIEAGVGVGVTAGADRLTFKLMVSRDITTRHKD